MFSFSNNNLAFLDSINLKILKIISYPFLITNIYFFEKDKIIIIINNFKNILISKIE